MAMKTRRYASLSQFIVEVVVTFEIQVAETELRGHILYTSAPSNSTSEKAADLNVLIFFLYMYIYEVLTIKMRMNRT